MSGQAGSWLHKRRMEKADLSPEAVLDDGPDSLEPATETERAA